MTYDLAFLFVDLGDPWWRTAVTEMLRSAKRVMPDARIVQLTDSETKIHPWVDTYVRANVRCEPGKLSAFKGYMMAQHAMATDHPVIFCDADVIWTAKPELRGDTYIACDESAKHLRLRQFYLQTTPKAYQHKALWADLVDTLEALPESSWAGDAFELALNIVFSGDNATDTSPSYETTKFLMHFSKRPEDMIAFARAQDDGEPFKRLDPGYVEPVKQGVNEDLLSINFNAPLTIPSEVDMIRESFARGAADTQVAEPGPNMAVAGADRP